MQLRREQVKHLLFHIDPEDTAIFQLNSLGEPLVLPQLIQPSADQPRIPSGFVQVFLEVVHLFDDHHRNHNVVVAEGEKGIGVVEQHVRVQYVDLPRRIPAAIVFTRHGFCFP